MIQFDNFKMVYIKNRFNNNDVFIFIYFKSKTDKSYYMIEDINTLLCNNGYNSEISEFKGNKRIKISFIQKSEVRLCKEAYGIYYKSIAFELRKIIMDFLYGEYFNVGLFDCIEKVWDLYLNVSMCVFDYIEVAHNDSYCGRYFFRKRKGYEIRDILREKLPEIKKKSRGKIIRIINNAINNEYIVGLDIKLYLECIETVCKELNIDYVIVD